MIAVLISCLLPATVSAVQPTQSEHEPASVEETIAQIERVLQPLQAHPRNAWLGGGVPPFDLRVLPGEWYRKKHWHKEDLAAYTRDLLRAGACRGDATALKAFYDIEWRVVGLTFFQMESLYLERRAALIGLKLPFHERYRRRKKYARNMSTAPQREMRINDAFDHGRARNALAFVPRLGRLCR